MGTRVRRGMKGHQAGYILVGEGSIRSLAVGQLERTQLFVCLVLFLVLTCYITLENKNISKIIYNIFIS